MDWDIHHGNGIQNLTYDDPYIFYLSIHRACFDDQKLWFYPGTGKPSEVGEGSGVGTNLNLVWGQGGMGNEEYATAFSELVLPTLSAFQPDLILVACGLDAAKGDLLGDCGLSPDMYYIMTKSLLDQAGADIPIVMVLEGGYNINVVCKCMEKVALALLDEPCHDGQYYGLSRYLKPTDSCICSGSKRQRKSRAVKKREATAVSSIKQSASAISRVEGSYWYSSGLAKTMAPDVSIEPYHGNFGPLKKRKGHCLLQESSPSCVF